MALLAVRLGTSLCLGSTRDPCMLCHVFNLIKKIQSSFKLRSFDARETDWKSFSESYAQNFLDFDLQINFLTARYLPVNRFINHLDSILSPTHVRVDFAFAYCNRPTYSWRIGLLVAQNKFLEIQRMFAEIDMCFLVFFSWFWTKLCFYNSN